MDDTEDDARYPPNPYGVNQQQGYGSSARPKIPFRGGSYSIRPPVGSQYGDEEEEDDGEDEELGEEEEDDNNNGNGVSNGYPVVRKNVEDDDDNEDEDDDDDDDDDDEDDDDEEEEKGDHEKRKDYGGRSEGVDLERHPKKRKLKSLVSSYELAPRIPTPAPTMKPSSSAGRQSALAGRNSLTDWTERETFVLLDAWGDRFIQRGKKSLRSEEWQEVAEKVSEVSKVDRTDTQCRNRLDTLKKKYKKEKLGPNTNWVYFKKMDLLLSMSSPQQQTGLSCGLDSGEYVFMNPRVYLNRANGLDEMRDSPENSESEDDDGDGDGSDGLPPKKRKYERDNGGGDDQGSSLSLIANSIHKFSEIYEKIEASKRQQMMEIEKMRMDFQRDLEVQKRQIMERAHAEIAKIRRGDDDDIDVSAENGSG